MNKNHATYMKSILLFFKVSQKLNIQIPIIINIFSNANTYKLSEEFSKSIKLLKWSSQIQEFQFQSIQYWTWQNLLIYIVWRKWILWKTIEAFHFLIEILLCHLIFSMVSFAGAADKVLWHGNNILPNNSFIKSNSIIFSHTHP